MAHRGAHTETTGGARENTIPAIRAALDAGVTWIEVDVRLTRDSAVVLLHDSTLERLWGDSRAIADVDLAEVRELGGGERRVPLLAEALDVMHGTGATLLIDMDDTLPAAAAATVVQASSSDAATAWCGDPEALRIVRTHLPDAAIWMPWYTAEPPTASDLEVLAPTVVNTQHLLVGAAFVEAVHALGAEVAVWTVDSAAQAWHLARTGVDVITTNELLVVAGALDGMTEPDEVARQLAIVSELAEYAASLTVAARREGVGAVDTKKNPADHVTEIDRGIERWVRQVLGAQFPDHDIVGEEYGGSTDGERGCWFLDPIDGTANLANGVPWTSFSLALVEGGRPVIGAVLDPVGSAVDGVPGPVPVVAARGRGAWRRGHRLAVVPPSEGDPLSGAIVSTELSGALAWPSLHGLLDALGARYCTMRVLGSGTAALAGVALGYGAAALVHRSSVIDHAAALLVVSEAGGTVLGADGMPAVNPDGRMMLTAVDERTARALWREWDSVTTTVESRAGLAS